MNRIIPPTFLAAITPPVEVIAVTKDQEFRNQKLLIICSFLFGIHNKLFLVSLEKEVLSIFTSILKFWITFHKRIDNHCLIQF